MPQAVQRDIHLWGSVVSQSPQEGVQWEKTEWKMPTVERSGTSRAARQKRESLGQSGVFVHIPRGRRGFPCSPSLLTHIHYTKYTGTDKWCNVKQSRGIKAAKNKKRTKSWLCRHPVNPVMNLHSAKSWLQTFCNVLPQRNMINGFCANKLFSWNVMQITFHIL